MDGSSLNFSVGLEIHARLKTEHKIFCKCLNRYGDEANSNTCPVCLGLPGSLPVLNQMVVEPAIKTALALGCHLPEFSEFTRKNYFYPDLPRNFQITQYERPLALGGSLEAGPTHSRFKVQLRRIHLEEDAGRSLHRGLENASIDFNRAGAPLMELVTEPDLKNGLGAYQWLVRLRQLLRWLDVSDGDMEKGSFRCDANVGLLGEGDYRGPWVELKNLNSFKAVHQAIDFEIDRLGHKIQNNEKLCRETRQWDPRLRKTSLLRIKTSAADYRYFPEPDLPLLELDKELVKEVEGNLVEMPMAREMRYQKIFSFSEDDTRTLCRSRQIADYFEACLSNSVQKDEVPIIKFGQLVGNWVLGPVLNAANGQDSQLIHLPLSPQKLAEVVDLQVFGKANKSTARNIIDAVLFRSDSLEVGQWNQQFQLEAAQFHESLVALCRDAIYSHDVQRIELSNGNSSKLDFFVGQVMSRAGRLADAQDVRRILLNILNAK